MIVFLDVDGVLHPDPAPIELAFCRRQLLWQILVARPVIRVVIASDWRLRYALHELIAEITRDGDSSLRGRFIDVTPELPGARHAYRGRERECQAWLEKAGLAGSNWIALDDVASNFAFGSPHLILTDYRTGLTDHDVNAVLSRISAVNCI